MMNLALKNLYGVIATIGVLSFLLFSGFGVSSVKADSFYPGGQIDFCRLYQGTAVSIGELPTSCANANCVQYDLSQVKGESGNFISNTNFNQLATSASPYPRRFGNTASIVDVPPGTSVDISYFTNNLSGHPILVEGGALFLSRANRAEGDFTRLGAVGNYGFVSINTLAGGVIRSGMMRDISLNLLLPANDVNSPPSGNLLYRFETIQPLRIVEESAELNYDDEKNLILTARTVLVNDSTYFLPNVSIKHFSPSLEVREYIYNFSSGENREIVSEFNLGKFPDLEEFSIPITEVSDPNFHFESIAIGSNTAAGVLTDSFAFIARRNDLTAPHGWFANQPDLAANPYGSHIGVNLLPYKVYGQLLEANIPELLLEVEKSSEFASYEINDENEELYINFDIAISNSGRNIQELDVVEIYDIEVPLQYIGMRFSDEALFMEELTVNELLSEERIVIEAQFKANRADLMDYLRNHGLLSESMVGESVEIPFTNKVSILIDEYEFSDEIEIMLLVTDYIETIPEKAEVEDTDETLITNVSTSSKVALHPPIKLVDTGENLLFSVSMRFSLLFGVAGLFGKLKFGKKL